MFVGSGIEFRVSLIPVSIGRRHCPSESFQAISRTVQHPISLTGSTLASGESCVPHGRLVRFALRPPPASIIPETSTFGWEEPDLTILSPFSCSLKSIVTSSLNANSFDNACCNPTRKSPRHWSIRFHRRLGGQNSLREGIYRCGNR